MNIKELLREEIENELAKLDGMTEGSDEYKATVDGIAKLTDRLIEFEKLEINGEAKDRDRDWERKQAETDLEWKQKQAETDLEWKQKQMDEDKKDRLIKNCISVAGIVLPLTVTIWGTLKSIQFEKEGTITTIMGRGFIGKLLPKK